MVQRLAAKRSAPGHSLCIGVEHGAWVDAHHGSGCGIRRAVGVWLLSRWIELKDLHELFYPKPTPDPVRTRQNRSHVHPRTMPGSHLESEEPAQTLPTSGIIITVLDI